MRGLALLFLTVSCARPAAPLARADDARPVAPSPSTALASACGGYEGGRIGNFLVCFKLTRAGQVSSSSVDVGSPYDRRSDVACGKPLVLFGVSYLVTCALNTTADPRGPSTEYALVRDADTIPLFRRLNDDDGWWANVKVIGDDAYFTFRFHKLD